MFQGGSRVCRGHLTCLVCIHQHIGVTSSPFNQAHDTARVYMRLKRYVPWHADSALHMRLVSLSIWIPKFEASAHQLMFALFSYMLQISDKSWITNKTDREQLGDMFFVFTQESTHRVAFSSAELRNLCKPRTWMKSTLAREILGNFAHLQVQNTHLKYDTTVTVIVSNVRTVHFWIHGGFHLHLPTIPFCLAIYEGGEIA